MKDTDQAERRRAVTQVLASWRMEGFEPDTEYRELLEQYIQGTLSLEQLTRKTDERFGICSSGRTTL